MTEEKKGDILNINKNENEPELSTARRGNYFIILNF